MKQTIKKLIAFLIAFVFAFTGAFMFNGTGTFVYGETGGEANGGSDDQETTYSQDGGVLAAIGVDTSVMPETYDPDSTDNPYGSDVINLSEMNELVKIDTQESNTKTYLYGHNKKLDGKYTTLEADPTQKSVSGPAAKAFIAADNCDVSGSGRDSAVAMLYCNYRHKANQTSNDTGTIYMKIYDPESGRSFDEPITITDNVEAFVNNHVEWNYHVQSQLQIAAGDFDNDTVEEIAVYVPAAEGGASRVAIYDLTNGGNGGADPYDKNSWQNVWNYVLPKSSAQIVSCDPPPGHSGSDFYYISNFYNNIDLAAADADNDGSCDLVISYGASDVSDDAMRKQNVIRSLPSESVILYGSNGDDSHGVQMLRDSQKLDLGGDDLIRVSFGFGDLDGDGNEEMVMGGQLKSEQSDNSSRVLAKYSFGGDSVGMFCEGVQKMTIVSGQWIEKGEGEHKTKTFASGNGWDGYYHCMPVMCTNIAVGKLFGQGSDTRIYMDSVLYSYDTTFELVDEMEDPSPEDPNDHSADAKKKGSAVFVDMFGFGTYGGTQMDYYEYGAAIGNFTASAEDYLLVQRVSQERPGASSEQHRFDADACVIVPVESDDNDEVHNLKIYRNKNEFDDLTESGSKTLLPVDTDMDSCVAKYTGKHDVKYQDPKVLAVIASAPYFKDVADYDEGNMLSSCQTTYGESTGNEDEYSQNVEIHAGLYTNMDIVCGAKTIWFCDLVGIDLNADTGFQYTHDWGDSISKNFEVTYGASAGEDQVVLFSTPTENFTYEVTTGAVDDEGNVTMAKFLQTNANPHKPVAKVIPLDKYKEIRKNQSEDALPDVTKYLTSKPGHPETYPRSSNDLPKAVTDSWKDVSKYEYIYYQDKEGKIKVDWTHWVQLDDPLSNMDPMKAMFQKMEKEDYVWYQPDSWEGAGFGNGFISQTLSAEHGDYDRKGYGGYFDLEVGAHFKQQAGEGIAEEFEADAGVQFGVSGDKGTTYSHSKGVTCSGTVANMPRSAENYGYDFSWSLLEYSVHDSKECIFPVVTYMLQDIQSPPKLPDSISQDFDQTTDSQICLNWTYSQDEPLAFDIYRYKDFPQGGGDELVGTVAGNKYTIRKDADGNTIKDADGKPIKEYSFIEEGLTADTKYNYRMKVRANKQPSESIFSPIIEARTDVSEKPALSLSADKLTLYPDGQYSLNVELADPEHYETGMDYQWQKYDKKALKWLDQDGKTNKTLTFTKCNDGQTGEYRCRVNLVRKHEGSPQYISAYTNICEVSFSLREVKFDPISVFEGTGSSVTNTGVSVGVKNASSSSTTKPTGTVTFTFTGPNGTFSLDVPIDQQTGIARVDSMEDELGSPSQEAFVNGGYLVTAEYKGDKVFKAAKDDEEYHYLRKIGECDFLSMKSNYFFGQDVMPTTNLFNYKQDGDHIKKTDITDKLSKLELYMADDHGQPQGDAVASITLSETSGVAKIPLNAKLKKRAYVKAYVVGQDEAVAGQIIKTAPKQVQLYLSGKVSGGGNLLKLYSFDDIQVIGDCDLKEKNMVSADGGDAKSLEELLVFKYYEDSGSYMFDSTQAESHKSEFIPARYKVDLAAKDNTSKALYETFYAFNNPPKAEFLVVGSYYEVTAIPSDEAAGTVRLISPYLEDDVNKLGFPGGTKITLKALPSPGFRIKKWIINDGQGGTQTQNGGDLLIYTLRSDPTLNSDGQVNVTAIFEPKNQTLTYEPKGSGTITVDPFFASGSTVLEGTQMQFTAQANDGWHFKEWRWTNFGGNDSVSLGNTLNGNINSKTYTMGDTAAAVYAVFFRDTIDIDLDEHLNASYINNGGNPLEDEGKEISVDNGKSIPKGTTVRVVTASGYEPAKDAEWVVNITTPEGTSKAEVREIMSGSSEGCEFDLPEDVTACSVQLETEKGYYSVGLEGTGVKYEVKLDGVKVPESQYQQMLQRIEGGTLVEVDAIPDRGKLFDCWQIDGVASQDVPQEYSFTLKDSVTLQATVKDDEKHNIKLKGVGNGIGRYTITGHNGEVVSKSFGTNEITVEAYKGESLSICDDPEDLGNILTAVKMNGVRQDLVEGVFTLESITEDAEFVCNFQPTTYCTVNFQIDIDDTPVKLLDSNGAEMDATQPVETGTGEVLEFSVLLDKNYFCSVRNNDAPIPIDKQEPVGEDIRYDFKFTVNENTTLVIDDCDFQKIHNLDELNAFMLYNKRLNESNRKQRVTGVLKDDIEVPEGATITQVTGAFQGVLDGNGHTIRGLKLNGGLSDDNVLQPYDGKSCLFESIAKGGAVKNLTIEGFDVYVKQYRIGDDYGSALITKENHGTISGVILKDCSLGQKSPEAGTPLTRPELAGIAVNNSGVIEACAVTGLKLQTGRDNMTSNLIGCAIALKNHMDSAKGCIDGCYVEGLKISKSYGHGGDYMDAGEPIIADDMLEHGSGLFLGNYFRVYNDSKENPKSDGSRAQNIWTITDEPDNALFAGNLAYHINNETEGGLWGIHKPAEPAGEGIVTPEIIPLAYDDENCKEPVKAEFKYKTTEHDFDYELYLYPDKWKLPGREKFGNDENLAFWKLGDEGTVAYSVGYDSVDIQQDMTFFGVKQLDGVVAELYGVDAEDKKTNITCYNSLEDAFAAAAATEEENPHLDIVGNCTMESGSFTVKEGMTMTVCEGATLTMNRKATIVNKGVFTTAEGSRLDKYGSINNYGTINVPVKNVFYNYGSKLKNAEGATIDDRKKIHCDPHLWGEWQIADMPNEDGTWTNTAVCEICTNEMTENIDPNPEADEIKYIEVYRYPTTAEYHTGDAFDDSGLLISAVLKSGCRAKVTSFNMTISDGVTDPVPIQDGDILKKHGAMEITVNYKGFTCNFPIMVRSAVTGIAIADGERELNKAETLQLKAVITPEGVQADIQWKSEDENIATVDKNGLVTGVNGGQVKITATVDDMSASCTVIVHEAATSLELDEYKILVPTDGNELIAARVAPATADGEVTWKVADPSVAGLCVTDPETGEKTVVDEVTTKLSKGNGSEASSYMAVTGVGAGQTVITVSVKDDRGLPIHKNCTVDVQDPPPDTWVRMIYDGAAVSGKTVTVDSSEKEIMLRGESSIDGDTLDWSSVDDKEDPVISVSDSGKVTLLRSGMAAVRVKSDTSNLTDICILNVVSIPTSIKLSSADIHMAAGVVKMLSATMTPEKVDGSIEWTSSDKKVATVSSSGAITGVGEGTAVITARSSVDPDVHAECTVTVYDPNIQVKLSDSVFYYDGMLKRPSATVTSGSQTLAQNATESNSRVLLIYEGALSGPGKVNVTAIGRDDGMGVANVSYDIKVKPTEIKKVKRMRKALRVKWKKGKKGTITGYQVQVSTDPQFTKHNKTKRIKKYKTKKTTIKKLKKKKVYYVRVRTYLKVGGTTYYSDWSPVKTKKTK